MNKAIRLALNSLPHDMPFGCLIVADDHVFARAGGTGNHGDPTAHSEMQAIQYATEFAHSNGHDLLKGFTLYSTHEPCAMCCGAINHAKISRVVWGSYRDDLPALFRHKMPAELLLGDTSHPPQITGGVLRQECIDLFNNIPKWD